MSRHDQDAGAGGPTLVFVYGPPAVGKLTVAQAVGARTGYRVLHNHATIDAVTPVFDWGTRPFFRLVDRFRSELVTEAAAEGVDLVFTFAYASPHDDRAVTAYVDPFLQRGGRVLFVQLTAPDDALLRRAGEPSRSAHGKLTDAETLRELIAEYDFTEPVPFEPNLTIDTTTSSPAEAAERIVTHYGLARP